MTIRSAILSCFVLALAIAIKAPQARAGGPLIIDRGIPFRWNVSVPVVLNLDPGPLGSIPHLEARSMVLDAITEWNSVRTTSLRTRLGNELPTDIEGLSASQFDIFVTLDNGSNPIVFDSDGSIIDALYGPGSGVLGVSGPSLVLPSSFTIVKGFSIFNGRTVTQTSRSRVTAVITHEIGHLFNLGHSQVNGVNVGLPIPGFEENATLDQIETMFPLLVQSSSTPHPMSTLHKDDIVAISSLYPTADFASQTGAVYGRILQADGKVPVQGVNVVARNMQDPFDDAVSFVSGLLAGYPTPLELLPYRGSYELEGLTAGATYKVYAEEVGGFFTAGSNVGPLDPPVDIDPRDVLAFLEFWNGSNEGSENPPDDPFEAAGIVAVSGNAYRGVDIILNDPTPRLTTIEPSSGDYDRSMKVVIQGANLVDTITVRLDNGTLPTYLERVEVVGPGELGATVPGGIHPGVYSVLVETTQGRNSAGEVYYHAIEPLPSVFSTDPAEVDNTRARKVALDGDDLLGTQKVRLVGLDLADVEVEILRIFTSDTVLVEVPAGVFPGEYRVVATNTTGDSEPSAEPLTIVELPPILSGDIYPTETSLKESRIVTVYGQNLAGTSLVELVGHDDQRWPLSIRSSNLDQVVVVVPAGLSTGLYAVALTNTQGSIEGPTEFAITPPTSGGGGGGCSAVAPTGGRGWPDLPVILLVLVAVGWLRRAREKTPSTERGCAS